MAVVYSRCEQYELAIEYHERSFEIKKLQAPGSLSFATTSLNLADLWMTKDLSKAISYLKRAQLIAEAHRPVPYAFLSDVFTVTANILRHTEFYNEAIDMYLKAMILEEAVDPDSEKLETLRTELYNAQLESQSSWSSHRNAAKRLTGVGPDNMSSLPQDPANAVLPGNYPQDHIEDCINYAAASWAVMPSTLGAQFHNSIEESVQDASSDAAAVGEPSCPSSTVSEDSAQNQPQMVPLATPPAPRDLAEDGDLLDMLVDLADKGASTEYPDFRQTLSMESMNPQICHSLSSRGCVSLPRPVSESDDNLILDNSILHVQSSQDNSYASLSPMPYPDGTPEDPLELTLAMAKSFPPHRRNSTHLPTKPNRSRRKLKQKTPAPATLSSSSYGAPVQESRFPDESPRHIEQ
jgi:tetratricopeptide (TPR) repeat protein